MITPIALGAVKRYTVKGDDKDPTVWLIGSIDSISKTKLLGDSIKVEMGEDNVPILTPNLKPLEQDLLIVKIGLKGYENFKTKFATEKMMIGTLEIDVVTDDVIKTIPQKIISELSTEIWGENIVSEKERKN